METIELHLVIGLSIFVAFFSAFKKVEQVYFPPALMFVAGMFSSTYLYAFAILQSPLLPPVFAYANFDEALWLTSACFSTLLMGYVWFGKVALKPGAQGSIGVKIEPMMQFKIAVFLSLVGLLLAVFLAYYNWTVGVFSGLRGEDAYEADFATLTDRIGFATGHLLIPLLAATFISTLAFDKASQRSQVRFLIALAGILIVFITLLSFSRHQIAYLLLCFVLILHFRVRSFRARDFVFAFFVIVIAQTIRNLRTLGIPLSEMDFDQLAQFLLEQIEFANLQSSIAGVFTGIAGWDVFTNVLDLVPAMDSFKAGSTYLESAVGIITPRVLGLAPFDQLTPSRWYVELYAPDTTSHGFDFSMLSEAYINFGYFMPIFFFGIGCLLAYLSISIRKTPSPFLLFFCVISLVALTVGLRTDSNSLFKAMFYQTIPLLLLIRISNAMFGTGKTLSHRI